MNRFMLSVFLILLLISPLVFGGQAVSLSRWWTESNSPSYFYQERHFPLVVTNDYQHEWLVVWAQSKILKGRIVKPSGQLGSIKTLVKATANSKSLLDVVFDPIHHTYLILYRGGQNHLEAQLLSASLGRIGNSHLVRDPGTSGFAGGQLVFDPVAQKYLVFWIEKDIKSIALNASGTAISGISRVLNAGSNIYYDRIRVARNPQNGNLFLLVSQFSNGVGSILGYTLNSDRTFVRTTPVTFSTKTVPSADVLAAFFSVPDAEFGAGGAGVATWATNPEDNGSTPTTLRIRKITNKGTFGFKSKFIPEGDSVAVRSNLVLDQAQEKVLVLLESADVTGALLDQKTGDVLREPILFAKHLSFGRFNTYASGVNGAYENSSGKILIVWATECGTVDIPYCPGSTYSASQVNAVIYSNKSQGPGPFDLNGMWDGKTGEGKNFDFEVVNNKILTFDFEWVAGTCTGKEAVRFVTGAPISSDKFSTGFLGQGAFITIHGTFTSETTANGTLYVEGSDCGFGQNSWTAIKK